MLNLARASSDPGIAGCFCLKSAIGFTHTVFLAARKSRTLHLLAFDGKSTFDFCFIRWDKASTTSERENKLSNPRAHAARERCMEKIYGNFMETETRARAPRARHALISSRPRIRRIPERSRESSIQPYAYVFRIIPDRARTLSLGRGLIGVIRYCCVPGPRPSALAGT
jgi:hypothetical protein